MLKGKKFDAFTLLQENEQIITNRNNLYRIEVTTHDYMSVE